MSLIGREFMMDLFLNIDEISTTNRVAIAIADIVSENSNSLEILTDTINNIANKDDKNIEHLNRVFVHYTLDDYIKNINIEKNTYKALVTLFEAHSHNYESIERKIIIFLWTLTSVLSLSEVGKLFNVSKSLVSSILYEVSHLICQYKDQFINWPSDDKQFMTSVKVNSAYKFPNCIGFVDTCRFKVKREENSRKFVYLNLQAVCDESLKFINIHIGKIGKLKKNNMYKNSFLPILLKNISHDKHILGDSDYKLKNYLMTPFAYEEILTYEEIKFNEVHSNTKSYIGVAFELLKRKFPRLNKLNTKNIDNLNQVICAACVLHNFILLHEGSPEIKEERVLYDEIVSIDKDIVKTAVEKRQFLCNYINYINTS